MPMTFDGNGTITGLSAGGLPDATVTTAEIVDASVTAAKMSGAQSGSAPVYGARAWVNFNGTGTVAIRASGNVSSITDGGTGVYTVNFTTAMPDVNYSMVGVAGTPASVGGILHGPSGSAANQTTSAIAIYTLTDAGATFDASHVFASFFR
jgi:hypothetical protein